MGTFLCILQYFQEHFFIEQVRVLMHTGQVNPISLRTSCRENYGNFAGVSSWQFLERDSHL